MSEATRDFFINKPVPTEVSVNGGHGRIETRRCRVLSTPEVAEYVDWPGIQSLIEVERLREFKNDSKAPTRETADYVSSKKATPQEFQSLITSHWAIENSLHWVLDVSFGEDQSRIRKGNAPKNMTTLRHVAINMIKKVKKPRESIKGTRKKAGWDNEALREILTA